MDASARRWIVVQCQKREYLVGYGKELAFLSHIVGFDQSNHPPEVVVR